MSAIDCVSEWLRAHHDAIGAFSALAVAAFTAALTYLAIRQTLDSRIIQRAYVTVAPGGVKLWSTRDKLLSHLIIQNGGNLPATKVRWFSKIEVDTESQRSWFPIDKDELDGDHTIPAKGELIFGSPGITLQDVLAERDTKPSCYIYVWGLVCYENGFGKSDEIIFCHRYDYMQTRTRAPSEPNLYELAPDLGRHHQY